jgi:uncharacterized protein YuzE
MKVKVDRKADGLYLRFDHSKIIESEQVAPGVIVDFDNKNRVVGVEVLDVSKRIPARKHASSRVSRRSRTAQAEAAALTLVRESAAPYRARKKTSIDGVDS